MRGEKALDANQVAFWAPPMLTAPALARLPHERLAQMRAAGEKILECRRVLRKGGLNIVGEVLRSQGEFREYNHYPNDDVYDRDSHAQYYYHAHRGFPGEHGHFHTFLRASGMPRGITPATLPHEEPWPECDLAIAHLVAISMDSYGEPIGLFAPNRWVGGDTWYHAAELERMLPRFRIDHAFPSWPVNRWITAMLALFAPHIEQLLRVRDDCLRAWRERRPGEDLLEDRSLEILAQVPVSVDDTLGEVHAALAKAA